MVYTMLQYYQNIVTCREASISGWCVFICKCMPFGNDIPFALTGICMLLCCFENMQLRKEGKESGKKICARHKHIFIRAIDIK